MMNTNEIYIVLNVLAIRPGYWRKGLATTLVESGIREIQAMGLNIDILVRAKKAALGVYKRAGFKINTQLIQDASKFGIKDGYAAYFLIKEMEVELSNTEMVSVG
jgi:ribosomal protein S18 acetylase RimI-like enzyme